MLDNQPSLFSLHLYEAWLQALYQCILNYDDKIAELKDSNYQLQEAFVTIKRNLTLLEKQNRRSEEANRSKSEFLANMSHELRTPLNGIIGFAELMHDGAAGELSLQQKEYINDILTSARHLLQLVNDVLDLAKVEAGKMVFNPHPINPLQLLTELKNTLNALIAKKDLKVTIEIEEDLPDIIIDPDKFEQVIYNYISNAIKFTRNNGVIKIIMKKEDVKNFRLEVYDTGIGIAKENFEKIFMEFQQIETGLNNLPEGTGLGLIITRRIVEAQGGHVGFTSQLNVGSMFYAVLPYIAQ